MTYKIYSRLYESAKNCRDLESFIANNPSIHLDDLKAAITSIFNAPIVSGSLARMVVIRPPRFLCSRLPIRRPLCPAQQQYISGYRFRYAGLSRLSRLLCGATLHPPVPME